MEKNPKVLDLKQIDQFSIPGGTNLLDLVAWEISQSREEGLDSQAIDKLEQQIKNAGRVELLSIYEQLLALPKDPAFPYDEPNDLESIRKLRKDVTTRKYNIPQDEAFLFDRMYGAWLARSAGCTLGGPGEMFRPDTRARLKKYLTAISPDEWPMKDYMPCSSPHSGLSFSWKQDATREKLNYAPADDDLTHTVIAQIALLRLENPLEFKTKDLANIWFRYMPYKMMEGGTGMLAMRNLILRYPMGIVANDGLASAGPIEETEIDTEWTATHSNPYREDIDAAIRADSYGYAAPGMPEVAAGLAWQDARISNVKNGIYCSMFYAAMVSAAFALDDPLQIVEAGLAEIPATSRLYEAACKTVAICQKYNFDDAYIEDVYKEIYETFGDNHNGTPNNMSLVVIGILMGGHDMGKVITYTVMGGWDCDSTAATSGSICGAMLGAKKLPAKWIAPLKDTLMGQIIGYHPIALSECARLSVEIAKRVFKNCY